MSNYALANYFSIVYKKLFTCGLDPISDNNRKRDITTTFRVGKFEKSYITTCFNYLRIRNIWLYDLANTNVSSIHSSNLQSNYTRGNGSKNVLLLGIIKMIVCHYKLLALLLYLDGAYQLKQDPNVFVFFVRPHYSCVPMQIFMAIEDVCYS